MAAVYEYEKNAELTFGKAFEQFYDSRKNIMSPTTLSGYRSLFRTRLVPLHHIPLKDLSVSLLQKVINTAAAETSPKFVSNLWGLITVVLRHHEHPVPTVRLPQKDKKEIVIPTDEEIKTMISACEDEDLTIAIMLSAFCGLRRGEICALDNADISTNTIRIDKSLAVDTDNQIIAKKPKSASGFRTIRIPPDLCKRIADNIEKTGKAVNIPLRGLTKRFQRILNKCGLPHYRLHDLRHYCASSMIAQGIPEFYIVRYLGHADAHMVKTVYGHLKKQQADQFADRMDEVFSSFNF